MPESTMNPGRIHVEQSSKILFSAGCAKEGNTNEEINVAMSDKSLVRNLTGESTGLETKPRNPTQTFVTSDAAALLRERDLEIEKLKKELLELTEQLDLARSRIEDLQQVVGEKALSTEEEISAVEKLSTELLGLQHQYPKLRVRKSWDSENVTPESPMSTQPSCQDIGVESSNTSPHATDHRCASSDNTLFQLPYFKVHIQYSSPFQPHVRKEESEAQPHVHIKEIEEQPNVHEVEIHKHPDENSEDYCKEVPCIEMENSGINAYPNPNMPECCPERHEVSPAPPQLTAANSEPTEVEKDEDEVKEVNDSSLPPKEEKDPNKTPPHCVFSSADKSPLQLLDKDINNLRRNSTHPDVVSPSPDKPPPWLLVKYAPRNKGLRLLRSRSCRASFMSHSAFSWFDKGEKITNKPANWFGRESFGRAQSNLTTPTAFQYGLNSERLSPNDFCQSTPSNWFEKDFSGRPESVQTTPAFLPYGANKGMLSIDESQAFASGDSVYELKAKNVEASNGKKAKDFTYVDGAKKTACAKKDKQIVHHLVNEIEKKSTLSTKTSRGVALDPMQDYLATLLAWPMEFKRLQKEIVELWHACNVSLSHRTYFFLLHRGDQKDCTYLEVEHRRLLFLKESLSRGNRTNEDGLTPNLSSSLRALNRERHKLSEQMQKRLSKEERENMFQRWGIGLKTKHRRLQLAHRLWSETKDMEHIKESASAVGKLLGYVDINLASKDIFGPTPKKSSCWKRRVVALSIL